MINASTNLIYRLPVQPLLSGFLLLILCLFQTNTFAKTKFYPGELVDIGTHRLHIHCVGEKLPTIVIDSGVGGFSLEWIKIQHKLAKNARVCSYDRAGYGWSDMGPRPRTTKRITNELHELLSAAKIPGPYLLVGHSFGGYNIRYFATDYPEQVAGLVFIDASHPEQFKTEEFKNKQRAPITYTEQFRSGRGLRSMQPVISNKYPVENLGTAYRLMTSMKARMTLLNELNNMEYSANQLVEKEQSITHHFPVVVITRGKRVWPHTEMGDRREQQWSWLQSDLANVSDDSYQFVAKNSGHIVHLDEPNYVTKNILFALAQANSYQQAKMLMEKYHIRLEHIGIVSEPSYLSEHGMYSNIIESQFPRINSMPQQVSREYLHTAYSRNRIRMLY